LHNREGSALHDAMHDRLIGLGWCQIDIVDDDLGRSASGSVSREVFDRMVAEVCLGKGRGCGAGGIPLRAQQPRLAAIDRGVPCGRHALIDQEAIYAPRRGNDRPPLGLKGSLNEYKLDLLRQRFLSARYEKARWGELIVAAPIGFVKTGIYSRRILIGGVGSD